MTAIHPAHDFQPADFDSWTSYVGNSASVGALHIVPITKTAARAFVEGHHRHNEAPSAMQVTLCVALANQDGEVVGVATAGRPVARGLCDGVTMEVNRTCVEGYHKNANSMLYGAVGRAAKALGYRRLVTYTLHTESGESLKASGFEIVADVGVRSWQDDNNPATRPRYDLNLFGERRQAIGQAKYRWERTL